MRETDMTFATFAVAVFGMIATIAIWVLILSGAKFADVFPGTSPVLVIILFLEACVAVWIGAYDWKRRQP